MADRKLEVTVNAAVCVGTAQCENLATGTFRVSGGLAEVIDASGDTLEKIMAAAESCPVEAITVEDAESGEVLFPPD